jgi:hypothetical protein
MISIPSLLEEFGKRRDRLEFIVLALKNLNKGLQESL